MVCYLYNDETDQYESLEGDPMPLSDSKRTSTSHSAIRRPRKFGQDSTVLGVLCVFILTGVFLMLSFVAALNLYEIFMSQTETLEEINDTLYQLTLVLDNLRSGQSVA